MLPHPISVINSYCTLYSTCKEHVILNALDLRAWCISVAPTELAVTLFGGLCSPYTGTSKYTTFTVCC